MQIIDGVHFSLDTPEPVAINSAERCVKGWIVPKHDQSKVRLAVILDGIREPVFMGLSRPDVARHFSRPEQVDCGFIARFRVPVIDPIVRLVAEIDEREILLASISVDQNSESRGLLRPATQRVSTYSEWLASRERLLFWPDSEVSERLSALTYTPLISIILPTYNTDPYFLRCCITSVLEQRYANWQLCVVDDCSSDQRVLEYLAIVSAEDPRVQLRFRSRQGNISAASNSALEYARGEFIVLLDHDDELHPFALLEVVRLLNLVGDAHMIYSDEDKIDTIGLRSRPAFKPDFDLDMFLSFDYPGHLIALRRSVVNKIGGFRSECDGSQDWDLLVRTVEEIGCSAVRHISKPLYHWRMHESSTALDLNAKPYVGKAWSKVLSDHIRRTRMEAVAEPGLFHGYMRMRRLPPRDARFAVVIRAEDGGVQLSTLFRTADSGCTRFYQLCGSILNKLDWAAFFALSATPRISLVDSASVRSITELDEDIFLFVNKTVEAVNHSFVAELAAQALREDVGLVTGVSISPGGSVLHAGFVVGPDGEMVDPFVGMDFPQYSYMGQLSVVHEVESISHAYFAVRREHLLAVGGMGSISAAHMPRLVRRLLTHARRLKLKVLFTPYAVATLADADGLFPIEGERSFSREEPIGMNPNLVSFRDLGDIARGNLQ